MTPVSGKMYSWCEACSCYHARDPNEPWSTQRVVDFTSKKDLPDDAVIVPPDVTQDWYERYLAALKEAKRGA